MLSLFKMISITHGDILIDGIDIGTVPPNQLRSSLNAIPQEPYFLHGSIRLDAGTSGSKNDEEIWRGFDAVKLKTVIENKGGLDIDMAEATFSQGEKQLFCLSRAILKKSKVVVLDEANSK